MPDPAVAVALLALVALAEASPWVRVPIGLLLAIATLAGDVQLLPAAMIGAAGVTLARLALALAARRGREDAADATGRSADPLRAAMRRHVTSSPAFGRTTFLLAALPGVPAGFVFPMLGAMRLPLLPALAGTLAGRTPVLALTAALFAWAGRVLEDTDADAALTLGIFAVLLLVFRAVSLIDWKHRAETGRIRLRDPDGNAARLATMIGSGSGFGQTGPAPGGSSMHGEDEDVVEGELLGEELDEDSDDDPSPGIPPTGLAPS